MSKEDLTMEKTNEKKEKKFNSANVKRQVWYKKWPIMTHLSRK
jgi:hypothetical protein